MQIIQMRMGGEEKKILFCGRREGRNNKEEKISLSLFLWIH